jgi:hypothetical protein
LLFERETGGNVSPREALLEEMLSAWSELTTVIKELDGTFDRDLGDGWRVQDVLAHIALWERVAGWKLSGSDIPRADDLIDREPWDLNAFNEAMRDRWRKATAQEVVAELHAAHEALVTMVSNATDEDCATNGQVWTAIHEDGAGHYEHHLPPLQRVASAGQ